MKGNKVGVGLEVKNRNNDRLEFDTEVFFPYTKSFLWVIYGT